jgi:dTDP-4-dehydrorhamnose reductase
MRVLITGANGQLGSEIQRIARNYPTAVFTFKDLPELDICDFEKLEAYIIAHKITAVINCAAYTAVDKAEEESQIAEKVNSIGVLNLVNALEKVNGKLLHLSTDYVFDGLHYKPYEESDEVNPIGVYGKTKREGELAILNSTIDAIIIRTSWLYSAFGSNFVKTMLRLGKEKKKIGVISDQLGTPTFAKDLAETCLEILCAKNLSKISSKGRLYHYTNEGVTSWYDFAIAIMEMSGIQCKVLPIQTNEYPTLAKRPQYSVLNKSKIKKSFALEISHWRTALANCILEIQKHGK